MDTILKWGYSRIPVYRGRRTNIAGVMLVRPLPATTIIATL